MPLTVVMYHYVRRLAESRHPAIKGLERDAFAQQLKYIRRFYTPVTGEDVINALHGGGELPKNAILLTFDDGYLDHFVTVLPLLLEAAMSAVFFPPARCIVEGRVLDVNKIHFILASVKDNGELVAAIEARVEAARQGYELASTESYRARYAVAGRFDVAEVMYIKRMLQEALPAQIRTQIIDELFARFVSNNERAFARELYMDQSQLKCLMGAGMMVGSHGYNHDWLNHLSPADQVEDIDKALGFLRDIGVPLSQWAMCYPYGEWSESVLNTLRERGCAMAFTTETALADIPPRDPLLLPRLDTNDLPKIATASPNHWTLKACQ
jgi:peptidoglycan/xylan/chitin deacetylase (PgdA/CDA1 family)